MNGIEGRARFWDGPAVPARVLELSPTGALVIVPWSRSFTQDDAMAAYSACPGLELSRSLTVRCTVRWVSCGHDGLQFDIGFHGVDAAGMAELVELAATVSPTSRPAIMSARG